MEPRRILVVGLTTFVLFEAYGEPSGKDFWSVAFPGALTGVGTLALAGVTVSLSIQNEGEMTASVLINGQNWKGSGLETRKSLLASGKLNYGGGTQRRSSSRCDRRRESWGGKLLPYHRD